MLKRAHCMGINVDVEFAGSPFQRCGHYRALFRRCGGLDKLGPKSVVCAEQPEQGGHLDGPLERLETGRANAPAQCVNHRARGRAACDVTPLPRDCRQ